MAADHQKEIINYLSTFITEHKLALMEDVLSQRTNYITVVLEDIYQPHNASAVVRTADCFGIQQVHIIEGRNQYDVNPQVLRGSEKWVDIIKHSDSENGTKACFDKLRKDGYKLIGTTPHKDGSDLSEFKFDQPIALVFGTEETGLSEYAMSEVDEYLRIPMRGFTESFNLSVSAAICLYQITGDLHSSEIKWQLSDEEKDIIRLAWYKKVVRRSDHLIEKYLVTKN